MSRRALHCTKSRPRRIVRFAHPGMNFLAFQAGLADCEDSVDLIIARDPNRGGGHPPNYCSNPQFGAVVSISHIPAHHDSPRVAVGLLRVDLPRSIISSV